MTCMKCSRPMAMIIDRMKIESAELLDGGRIRLEVEVEERHMECPGCGAKIEVGDGKGHRKV